MAEGHRDVQAAPMPLVQADVGEVWDRISGALAETMRGIDSRPEDVYADLKSGAATLFMNDDGFVVLKMRKVASRGRVDCIVWVVYGFANGGIARYEQQLIGLARSAGAKRLRFYTRRAGGFGRLLGPNWQEGCTEFFLEVGP